MNRRKKTLVSLIIVSFCLFLYSIFLLYQFKTYRTKLDKEFEEKMVTHLKRIANEKDTEKAIKKGGLHFNKLLSKLNIVQNSFAFTINTKGAVKRYNDLKEIEISTQTVDIDSNLKSETDIESEISSITNFKELQVFKKFAEQQKSAILDIYLKESDENVWGFIEPITDSEWSLATIVLKDSVLMPSYKELVNLYTGQILFIISLAMLTGIAGFLFPRNIENKVWLSTSLVSVCLLIGICVLCIYSNSYKDYESPKEVALTDKNIIDGFVNKYHEKNFQLGNKKEIRIKVGMFIKNIELTSDARANITGYIWEKLDKNQIGKIKEGLLFSDSFETEMEDLFEKETENGGKIFGWHFTTSVKTNFNGTLYPFDVESLSIRIVSKDLGKNIIFIPDIDSYENITPELKPGLYNNIIVSGWIIKKSYFSYVMEKFNSTLGVFYSKNKAVESPELYFKLVMRRTFLGHFISVLLPIVVTLVMMFILLLTCSNDDSKMDKLGFSAGAILASTAALFFVVIVAQSELREKINADGLVYIDYYYFITYIIFMMVNIDSVMLCWPDKFRFVLWKDNLIAKVSFWPLVSILLFIMTIIYFCPE